MTKKREQREEKADVKTESKPVDPVKEEVESLLDNIPSRVPNPAQKTGFDDFQDFRAETEANEAEIAAAMAAEDEARSLASEREREALGLDPIEKMRRATGINIPDPNR
jgi:hypothetical protein